MLETPASATEIANAQLFDALLQSERTLNLLANDTQGLLASSYVGKARETAPVATRALLDAAQPRPELLAALALATHIPLVQQALATLRTQARGCAIQAAAHDTPEMNALRLQLEQTETDCEALLAKIEDHVPAWLAESDGGDPENQDAGLDLDSAA